MVGRVPLLRHSTCNQAVECPRLIWKGRQTDRDVDGELLTGQVANALGDAESRRLTRLWQHQHQTLVIVGDQVGIFGVSKQHFGETGVNVSPPSPQLLFAKDGAGERPGRRFTAANCQQYERSLKTTGSTNFAVKGMLCFVERNPSPRNSQSLFDLTLEIIQARCNLPRDHHGQRQRAELGHCDGELRTPTGKPQAAFEQQVQTPDRDDDERRMPSQPTHREHADRDSGREKLDKRREIDRFVKAIKVKKDRQPEQQADGPEANLVHSSVGSSRPKQDRQRGD